MLPTRMAVSASSGASCCRRSMDLWMPGLEYQNVQRRAGGGLADRHKAAENTDNDQQRQQDIAECRGYCA